MGASACKSRSSAVDPAPHSSRRPLTSDSHTQTSSSSSVNTTPASSPHLRSASSSNHPPYSNHSNSHHGNSPPSGPPHSDSPKVPLSASQHLDSSLSPAMAASTSTSTSSSQTPVPTQPSQPSQQQKPAPPKPNQVPPWQRGALIGSGAFGKVYLGLDLHSGQLLAVKEVQFSGSATAIQQQVTQLMREIALMRQLDHPNIVKYIAVERKGLSLFILMEYVPGGSLENLVRKFGVLSERVVRIYTAQMLKGLAYLHANKILHRDIKGANILLHTDGTIKLADFGASKQLADMHTLSLKNDAHASMKGTPFWMAPEVIKQLPYGRSADIWSVGCTVIEMATGRPPWSDFSSIVAAMYHIADTENMPTLPANFSPLGTQFLHLCFQRDPKKRPTAEELLQHPWITSELQAPQVALTIEAPAADVLSARSTPHHQSSAGSNSQPEGAVHSATSSTSSTSSTSASQVPSGVMSPGLTPFGDSSHGSDEKTSDPSDCDEVVEEQAQGDDVEFLGTSEKKKKKRDKDKKKKKKKKRRHEMEVASPSNVVVDDDQQKDSTSETKSAAEDDDDDDDPDDELYDDKRAGSPKKRSSSASAGADVLPQEKQIETYLAKKSKRDSIRLMDREMRDEWKRLSMGRTSSGASGTAVSATSGGSSSGTTKHRPSVQSVFADQPVGQATTQ